MERTQESFLEKWIYILKEWLDFLSRKKKEALLKPTIMSQRPGKGCILLQLERNTPGSVSTWRFNCELLHERSVVLTLDNLADLDRHLQRYNRQRDPFNTRREVVRNPLRDVSHRIGISLVNPLKRAEFIGVWDANFVDQWSTTHAEDYKAERIVLYTALRILSSYEVMADFFEYEIRSKDWWEQRIRRLCEGEFSMYHKVNLTFRPEIELLSEDNPQSNLLEVDLL
ncbi:MAG: hypothetical protein WA919_11620 [Coleofasciculaceae cyanobacterium]